MKFNNRNKKFIRKLIWLAPLFGGIIIIPSLIVFHSNSEIRITKETPENLELKKQYEFLNLSNQYNIKNTQINLFKQKDNEEIFININEAVQKLKGLFVQKVFKFNSKSSYGLEYQVFGQKIIFDTQSNKIYFDTTETFQFLENSNTIDYSKNIKYLDFENHFLKENDMQLSVIDLNKYGFKIFEKENNVFLPLSIFNLLFLSQSYYNIYFNGEKIVGVDSTINKDTNAREYNTIMNNIQNSTLQSLKQRQNNYNFILLLFDNFYGLKKTFLAKFKVDNFNEFFEKTGLKTDFLSQKAEDNANGYEKFVYEYLNELHTSITSGSYFHPANYRANPYAGNLSSTLVSYVETLKMLTKIRNAQNSDSEEFKLVHFHNDIAIIYLDSFLIGNNEEINMDDNYLYDSYFAMFEAMKRINQYNTLHSDKPIKKIILDISLNGGGSIAAMQKVAAFMTNANQKLYYYDIISKLLSVSHYRVDVNNDKIFNLNDGYIQYKWYILTGENTFSAANLLTHIAKTGKFARIIGNKTGGGMYSILPVVLPDGTSLNISSNNAWTAALENESNLKEENLPMTENGVDVDIEIPYLAYYNYDVIEAYLKDENLGQQKYNQFLFSVKASAWKKAYSDVEVYLKHIKNRKKYLQYQKQLSELNKTEYDTLDTLQTKIEELEKLLKLVKFQYEKENKQ